MSTYHISTKCTAACSLFKRSCHQTVITLPAQRGRVLYDIATVSSSFFPSVNMSVSQTPYVRPIELSHVTHSHDSHIFELISLRSLYMNMSWDLRSPRDHLGSQQKRAQFMSFQRNNGSS